MTKVLVLPQAIEGTYIDKKCPFTGNVSIRGRILSGESLVLVFGVIHSFIGVHMMSSHDGLLKLLKIMPNGFTDDSLYLNLTIFCKAKIT